MPGRHAEGRDQRRFKPHGRQTSRQTRVHSRAKSAPHFPPTVRLRARTRARTRFRARDARSRRGPTILYIFIRTELEFPNFLWLFTCAKLWRFFIGTIRTGDSRYFGIVFTKCILSKSDWNFASIQEIVAWGTKIKIEYKLKCRNEDLYNKILCYVIIIREKVVSLWL